MMYKILIIASMSIFSLSTYAKDTVLTQQSWCLSFSDQAGINVFNFFNDGTLTISTLEVEKRKENQNILHINNLDMTWKHEDGLYRISPALKNNYEHFININSFIEYWKWYFSFNETLTLEIMGKNEAPVPVLNLKRKPRFNNNSKETHIVKTLKPCDMSNLLQNYTKYSDVHDQSDM